MALQGGHTEIFTDGDIGNWAGIGKRGRPAQWRRIVPGRGIIGQIPAHEVGVPASAVLFGTVQVELPSSGIHDHRLAKIDLVIPKNAFADVEHRHGDYADPSGIVPQKRAVVCIL